MTRVLFLGDLVGRQARTLVIDELAKLRTEFDLDFIVINCENAAGGFGVTPKICEALFKAGADVLTTGNHVWDKTEIIKYINTENRLLRPLNMPEGTPGKGCVRVKNKEGKRLFVVNVMTNLFMPPSEPVFNVVDKVLFQNKLGRDADFILLDVHGEATSEKMALGHLADGRASMVVGTHTHVPTADQRILESGTAYQTDTGMCGNYDSVIGMEKTNACGRFRGRRGGPLSVAKGAVSVCGLLVEADKNGLATIVQPMRRGGVLSNS